MANSSKMDNTFARVVPQLHVLNVKEATEFYRDVLGFRIDWTWGENDYGSVSRNQITLFLSAGPAPVTPITCVLNVGEVDELCAEWFAKGATILSAPKDMPWGTREFTMADNNGHQFRVSRWTNPPRLEKRDAVDFKLVQRLATVDEYKKISDAVGWQSFTDLESVAASLPKSLFGVVAEIDGECIGMARIGGDGALFYYVMDVAVMPDLQRRGIGTALMNALVEFMQSRAQKHALPMLFTGAGRSDFYRRFGFEGPETWLYGMSARQLTKG